VGVLRTRESKAQCAVALVRPKELSMCMTKWEQEQTIWQ